MVISIFLLLTVAAPVYEMVNGSPVITTSEKLINTSGFGQTTTGRLYIVDNTQVKWNNARLACSSHDMVMATIDNEQENREVYAFLSGIEDLSDIWIAANDIYENGRYVWGTDGNSSLTYFDWIPGEPPRDPLCGCISIVTAPANSCGQNKCTGWKESVCTERKKTLCMFD